MNSLRRLAAGLVLALSIAACRSVTNVTFPGEPRAYPGFEGYSRPIRTSSPEAQAWFDQGLQLLYGFNHDEAIRSFVEAARHDPDAPMPWWGVAYAAGLHINNPAMPEAKVRLAVAAAKRAVDRSAAGTPVEAALARAVRERYRFPSPEDQSVLDQAYADAMQSVFEAHPDDADVGALFAEALMCLQPWDYWTGEGEPVKRTLEIVSTLERVLELDPEHPGANHFYIHAVEASSAPERGLVAADRLVDLVPGSGHLVHMPSHIYVRTGRWHDATVANERAAQVDERYFELAPPPDFYRVYYLHNLHFIAYSAMMEAREEVALGAARKMVALIPPAFLEENVATVDAFSSVPLHVLVRFGRWQAILEEPEPEAWRLLSRAVWHYARGVAFSATDRVIKARAELASFETLAAQVPDDWTVVGNMAADVLPIAHAMLEGELAFAEGAHERAFEQLRRGVQLEESLVYDEPPGWMQPVRHALGALLLRAGQAAEAQTVFQADLERHPRNGWALLGLAQASEALSDVDVAIRARLELEEAWAHAKERPGAACLCAER